MKYLNNKLGLAAILLLFLTSFSHAQKAARVLFSAELNSAVDSLRISYDSPFRFILLPVEIEGQVYRFVFDTGAQSTLISEQLAQKIHLAEKGEVKTVDVQKVSKKLSYGKIPSLKVGKFSYSGVGCIVNDFSGNKVFSCMRVDGILGMNVLKLTNWHIDYEAKTLTLLSPTHESSLQQASKLPFTTIGGIPHVDLLLNGQTQKFMIDLGNNGETVSIASKLALEKVNHTFIGTSSLGLFGEAAVDTIKEVTVDLKDTSNFILKDVTISQSSNSDANIGTGFIEKRFSQLFLDFKNNVISLQKRPSFTPSISYPFSVVMSESGYMVISAVEIGNTAFKTGDIIVGVNNFLFRETGSCSFAEKFFEVTRDGSISSLSIEENGQTVVHNLNEK